MKSSFHVAKTTSSPPCCSICKGDHYSSQCQLLIGKSSSERLQTIKGYSLNQILETYGGNMVQEMVISKIGPFQCDMCNYSTSCKSHLNRHRMRHTGERPFRCAFCNKGFITGHHLRYHTKTVHTDVSNRFQ